MESGPSAQDRARRQAPDERAGTVVDRSDARQRLMEQRRSMERDAEFYVERLLEVHGDPAELRRIIGRGIANARKQIDALASEDPRLQRELEVLLAQERALAAHEARMPVTSYVQSFPEERAVEELRTDAHATTATKRVLDWFVGLLGRNRSKAEKIPSAPAPAPAETKRSGYDETWTPAARISRNELRAAEMAATQERAIRSLQRQIASADARLSTLKGVLEGRRSGPTLPARERARYVAESQRLQTVSGEAKRLLRIAEATRAEPDELRRAA